MKEILHEYSRSSLPYTVLVPSARYGLYALAKLLLRPGDVVALSPLTCRTVVHSFLRAGVRPCFLDVEAESGNLDVECLALRRLERVRAIVTTNLYGNPDRTPEIRRIARDRGWLLIEDCAHVLRTGIGGRWIGTMGDAAVFSFRKYFGVTGGVVATADARMGEEVTKLVAAECTRPAGMRDTGKRLQYWLELHAPERVARVAGRWGRCVSRIAAPRGAAPETGVSVGDGDPRFFALPDSASILRAAASLRTLPRLVEERARQAQTLLDRCGLRAGVSSAADCATYFALPFLTPERDQGLRRLAEAGVQTNYLYPPLHSVFSEEAAGMPLDEGRVAHWSRHVLPVRLGYRPEMESRLIACLEGLASDQPSSELAPVRDCSIF
ncbi:MAG: DegT/DnrJ/EryC1/StrS family aminotransferase [Acidobacteria bacterium]|nr:DegT/DnrJ/EryC1/StrS family aminotransferase [Acidobacteriota bacterium]